MKIVKPNDTESLEKFIDGYFLFLGGSIEQGKAVDWQKRVETELSNYSDDELVILNPRRDDWDPTWAQDPTPGTPFSDQVNWEIQAQDKADVILYNFEPGTISPITLLELGLYGTDTYKHIIVVCPKEFWRYGNVKIVCDILELPCFETLDEALLEIRDILETHKGENDD